MNAKDFIKHVQAMKGFPPQVVERLVLIAPEMTEERRVSALKELVVMHEGIVTATDAAMKEMEKGEEEMDQVVSTMHDGDEKTDASSPIPA